jgi:hypothetical protein
MVNSLVEDALVGLVGVLLTGSLVHHALTGRLLAVGDQIALGLVGDTGDALLGLSCVVSRWKDKDMEERCSPCRVWTCCPEAWPCQRSCHRDPCVRNPLLLNVWVCLVWCLCEVLCDFAEAVWLMWCGCGRARLRERKFKLK